MLRDLNGDVGLGAMAAWLAQAEADGLERGTLESYRDHVRLDIKPYIGATRIAQLTPAAIQQPANPRRALASHAEARDVEPKRDPFLFHDDWPGDAEGRSRASPH